MSASDELKEKLSQFDQETSQLLLKILNRQRNEIDFFERNWVYKYQDLYKNYFSDEAIMAIHDVDERSDIESQKTQLENSFKFQLKSLKNKHKAEYDNFTKKRLQERSLIFSTSKNATLLSYRINSPFPSPIKIKTSKRPNSDSKPRHTEKTRKKKKVRKVYKHSKTDNVIPDNPITDMTDTINSMSISQISNHHQFLPKGQNNQSIEYNSPTSYNKSKPNSFFLPSRSKFISNSKYVNGHITDPTKKSIFKPKFDPNEDFDVLDVKSLDKHFEKRDKIRKKIEKERQTRFEENFSYQINSKDVLNYKRKNMTDQIVLENIQNKRKSKNGCFDLIEFDLNNSEKVELDPKLKEIEPFSVNSKKIEEEEIKIAPVNKLDSIRLISESSSDSIEEKIPINQISLEYSYESYYSEYEVEEKIYLSPKKASKKKSKK